VRVAAAALFASALVALPASLHAQAPPQPAPPPADTRWVGRGFHLFDKDYVLLGFNWQRPCGANVFELEASYVPWISDGLWWFGFYAHLGYQHERGTDPCTDPEYPRVDSETDAAVRYDPLRGGAGLEAGWRMVTLDAGYVRNGTFPDQPGLRFRTGVSLPLEIFSGDDANYSRMCCKPRQLPSATDCECDRTPVGVAVFVYYAHELYFGDASHEHWADGMFGISLKLGIGL
jgi:hypothetical protein